MCEELLVVILIISLIFLTPISPTETTLLNEPYSSAETSQYNELPNLLNNQRLLNQQIIQHQAKTVQNILTHHTSFQYYHFQLSQTQHSIQLYLNPITSQQIDGHLRIMWRHNNVYMLPNVLQSQRVKLEIYQDGKRILQRRLYTRVGFRFQARQDRLYRIKVSQKKIAKFNKLISLSVEHVIESYQDQDMQQGQDREKVQDILNTNDIRDKRKTKLKVVDEQDSDDSSNDILTIQQEDIQFQTKTEQNTPQQPPQPFQLTQLSPRLRQLLTDTKLLINQAETKHITEHSIQKFISDSIQIYWQYEVVECVIVVACVFVEVIMVNQLFAQDKILV